MGKEAFTYPFVLPQPQAPALPASGGGAGEGSVLNSITPRVKPHLQWHVGSPMDITADKGSSGKETPVSQRDIRVSLGPQASSWLPPQAMGNKTRPTLPHLASPRHILLGRALPATTCVHWSSLSCALCHPLAHLCWQLGHSTDLLHFGISHALSHPPGPAEMQALPLS